LPFDRWSAYALTSGPIGRAFELADVRDVGGEGEQVVKTRVLGSIVTGTFLLAALPAAVLGAGQAELLEDFDSLIRYTDPATGEGVRALVHCDALVHLKAEDGSANEWQACGLSEDQPMGPVTPPATAVAETVGECIWTSDFDANGDGSYAVAASVELTVTPSGRVYLWSTYPAEPLACPEG
jgi:hypothetical protein